MSKYAEGKQVSDEFLMQLAKHGGCIVNSAQCSHLEIAMARAACDNRWLCIDSIGFVRRGR